MEGRSACQLHELFVQKGVRDRIALKVVIPTPRPVPSPDVSAGLERILAERRIELVPASPIRSIDAAAKTIAAGERSLGYDLFIGVPAHVPTSVVRAFKLGRGASSSRAAPNSRPGGPTCTPSWT